MTDPTAAFRVDHEPWYRPVADELALFDAAWSARMPARFMRPPGTA